LAIDGWFAASAADARLAATWYHKCSGSVMCAFASTNGSCASTANRRRESVGSMSGSARMSVNRLSSFTVAVSVLTASKPLSRSGWMPVNI